MELPVMSICEFKSWSFTDRPTKLMVTFYYFRSNVYLLKRVLGIVVESIMCDDVMLY
jgi:hypothetical protein